MKIRNANVDYLKLILSIMVIALHSGIFSEVSKLVNFIFVNGILRIAVPTFFVINGFYFYSFIEKKPIQQFVIRLIILYVIWMLIYLPLYWPNSSSLKDLVYFTKDVVIGYFHLWYILGVLGSGILICLLRKLTDRKLLVTAISLYCVGLIIQYISCYIKFSNPVLSTLLKTYWIYRNFLLLGFPFMVIGYLFAKNKIAEQYSLKFISITLLVGMLLLIFESTVNFYLGATVKGFDIYLSLLLASPAVLLFALRSKPKLVETEMIGKVSVVIFLVHPLFIKTLDLHSMASIYRFLIVFVLSILIAYPLIKLDQKYKYIL